MKKFLPVLLAVLMIFSITATVSAKDPFAKLNVPKCTTAPTIDGVIANGEYKLVSSYDKTKPEWNRDSSEDFNGKTPEMYVYATWDDDNFYVAVKIKNLEPNYTPGPLHDTIKYVFEQPSLMTAMVYDDPTLPVFASKDGKDWDWGAAYACTFAREWTIGITKDGTDFAKDASMSGCNHFGTVRDQANYKFSVKHGTYDVYEQAIPWSVIAKTTGVEVGGKCGLALSACVLSTTSEYDGGYLCYASGISGSKSFDRYAQVTLTANEPFEEEETSDPATSEPSTPETGDITAVMAIIAVIAIVGAGVVAKKRSR